VWYIFWIVVGLILLPFAVSLFGRLRFAVLTFLLCVLPPVLFLWPYGASASPPLLAGLATVWTLAWVPALYGITTKQSSKERARLRGAVRQLYFWHRFDSGRGKNAALWPSPLDTQHS
jgi:hypothetical protein